MGVPEVAELLDRPLDVVPIIEQLPLFRGLTPRHLSHLAQFIGWEFVPAGQNVTTQGNTGHSYVILREGAAAVVAYDDQGRERPRNKLLPVTAYGETSLLEGKARDATVRAVQSPVKGADVLVLDRRDLRYAFREVPELWTGEQMLVSRSVAEKETEKVYGWMREGEVLLWRGRPHPFWLIIPIIGLVLIALLLLVATAFVPEDMGATFALVALVVSGVVLLPAGLVIAYNYYDDYYAITNRRVTRRDRQLFIYESRQEAPVEMVQDVTVDSDFWGRVFDYGDLTMRTASKVGAIRFDNVPHAAAVKEFAELGRTEAKAAARGRQKEELRRGLIAGLQLALPIPQRGRPLGDVNPPAPAVARQVRRIFGLRSPRSIAVPTRPSTRPLMERLTRNLPPETRERLLGPPPKEKKATGAELVWRKHWLNLVARAGAPFLLSIVWFVGGFVLLLRDVAVFGFTPGELVLAWALLEAFFLGWLWWQYTDYQNDLYIVTDDRIIDIEMRPLGLQEKRREGTLDRVQNVNAVQNSIWANIFDYGDVVISTAAADEGFTFMMVGKPKLVQATIFQKLDAYRNRQEERRLGERQREIIEGLQVYHQLHGSRDVPPEWREY
jgi:membrane protein YdbS with pleckstrin-like domain